MKLRNAIPLVVRCIAAALVLAGFSGLAASAQQPAPKRPTILPRAANTQPAKPNPSNSQPAAPSQPGTNGGSQNGSAPCNTNTTSIPGRSRLPASISNRIPSSASTPCNNNNNSTINNQGNNRQPFNASIQGVGNFPGCCGYNMTLYSCFRNGGQVLCDFDVTNQHNVQVNAKQIYGDLRILNSSGRIFPRGDAFFVDDADGSQFEVSQITPGNKVRLIMVFENVPQTYTNVSIAQGSTVVQSVAISAQESGGTGTSQTSAGKGAQPK